MTKELTQYSGFVDVLTSDPSKDMEALITRLRELAALETVNIPKLMTGTTGLSAEAGEAAEIVKKVLYQGKPLDEATTFHLKRELGDIIFYWMMTVQAIGEDPYEVIEENIRKLKARYPSGEFSITNSEVRKKDDI